MTEDNERSKILKEILVAIDTSAHSRAALEAAMALAKITEAHIQGLFVEDEVWNKISRLPSISAVNEDTGNLHPYEKKMLDDQIKILKNRLRRNLERLGKRNKVKHSLIFRYGNVEEKILEAAEDADLLAIGLRGHSARSKRLGTSAKAIIEKANKPVLVLKKGLKLGTELMAVYDGTEQSRKGVELALDIAERNEGALTIMVLENSQQSNDAKNRELEKLLQDVSVAVEIEQMKKQDLSSFLNTVYKRFFGLIILPKDNPLFEKSFGLFLNHINCPILMMN